MKYPITILILLSLINYSVLSQEQYRNQLFGNIVDSETGNPLPYCTVAMGVESTFSNADGDFIFKVPFQSDFITISHIGYHPLNLKISQIVFNQTNYYKLQRDTLKLDEIIVKSQKIKEKAKDIVKMAVARIDNNLLQNFGADAFYRQIHYFNNVKEKKREYLRLLEAGVKLEYNGQNVSPEIYEIRSSDDLRFAENLKTKSVSEKRQTESNSHNLENFLALDYSRFSDIKFNGFKFSQEVVGLGSLNDQFLQRHKFKLDTIISDNGDLVYVIKVLPTRKSVDLLTRIKKFIVIPVGKLYVKGKDYAVVKMEYSYIVNPKKTKSNFSYAVTQMMIGGRVVFSDQLFYSDYRGKMYLSSIRRDIYDVQALGGSNIAIYKNLGGKESSEKAANGFFRVQKELIINKIYISSDESVFNKGSKKYQSLTPLSYTYNSAFWENFNSTQNTKEEIRLIRDLELKRSLEEQFKDTRTSY